jgi:hypothetical protein
VSAPSVNRTLTPTRRRWVVENDEYAAFTRRILAAHGRRIAGGDIEGLASLATLAEDVDTAMRTAVEGLRAAGFSWADVGSRLGMSRQAAHQRFGATARS